MKILKNSIRLFTQHKPKNVVLDTNQTLFDPLRVKLFIILTENEIYTQFLASHNSYISKI
jgi:hypothetical protein